MASISAAPEGTKLVTNRPLLLTLPNASANLQSQPYGAYQIIPR